MHLRKNRQICVFCKTEEVNQYLDDHVMNCAEYQKALTQDTCPLCHINVGDSMRIHLRLRCKLSRKYFQYMMDFQIPQSSTQRMISGKYNIIFEI